ncbi:carboxylesterase [Rhizocola hellebori]|uniref:Carboxylesterase n=1 Tax=Rhizocola hellebori TaxID=1392758 RepID=A0A8J3VI17_9ACTN|nr:alpha/beta fold hydrolase [Rhizocola hellebori]GIH06493.1 carboxylesterase [Rhizocola hellebori]
MTSIDTSPFAHEGSAEIGVLVCHGFTGSPHSMRPWAQYLAGQGWSVSLPLLPGHGTHWRDANRTSWHDWYSTIDDAFTRLRERCGKVFVCGLSMGGGLALRLAEERGDEVAGVVVVNPSVILVRWDAKLLPLLAHVLPSAKAIGNDIAKPDTFEGAYDRTPVRAAASLRAFHSVVRSDLHRVTQPLLLFRSANDHVVEPVNSEIVLSTVKSADVTEVVLQDSFHVATLDHDAPRIFDGSAEFIRRLSA